RAVIGTNNVDFPSGQLYNAPTVRALTRTVGTPAMSLPNEDLEHSGAILVVGSNTMESHPVLFFKIQKAVRKGARLILVDPHESTVARFASAWLRVKPGTDVAALNGLLRVILDDQLQDQGFVASSTVGFAELADVVRERTVEEYAAEAGVEADQLRMAAHLFATGGADQRYPIPDSWYGLFVTPGLQPTTKNSAIVYAGGLVQHPNGEDGVITLSNLASVTGMLGKLGAGLCPLPDQNNSQGACDVGLLPDFWPGYAPVGDAAAAARLASAWGIAAPTGRGRSFLEIVDGARTGAIKAVLVVGADPVRSAPGGADVATAFKNLEFLAVADIFPTETSALANVVFAAAAATERDGTFTNAERRVNRVRSVIPPTGLSRPDWYILAELSARTADRLGKVVTSGYSGPGDIMSEIASVIPAYGGISYAKIEAGGIQWPVPTADHRGTRYLFEDGFGDRKAVLVPVRSSAVRFDPTFPLAATPGRSVYFSTGVQSQHSKRLTQLKEAAYAEINPDDARTLGIGDRDQIRVDSRLGSLDLEAHISKKARAGQIVVFVNYGDNLAKRLAVPADSGSAPAELKGIAVRVERLGGPLAPAVVERGVTIRLPVVSANSAL
ncbi:MAG TPA: molybdopterin-dependent oxidoreductase, partial [Chloroflexota bacterium]|nr:molybdopterin-dependent oxidoreductase [Chloroflexota bacterium]